MLDNVGKYIYKGTPPQKKKNYINLKNTMETNCKTWASMENYDELWQPWGTFSENTAMGKN